MPKKKLKSIRSSKDDADPLSSGLHKNYTTERQFYHMAQNRRLFHSSSSNVQNEVMYSVNYIPNWE